MAEREDLYTSYIAFKRWGEEPVETPEAFEELFRRAGIAGAVRILDIGFGQGALLDWAAARGCSTAGVEVIPQLVEAAARRGHDVRPAPLRAQDFESGAFDAIFAIDVFEHLTLPDLRDTLRQVRDLLKDGGRCVARFPNAASPFFGAYMHGDLTHQTSLTSGAVRQLGEEAGLRLAGAYNPRPRARRLATRLKHGAAYMARDLAETVIGLAYFGHRFPMDPNVLVVLTKPGHA